VIQRLRIFGLELFFALCSFQQWHLDLSDPGVSGECLLLPVQSSVGWLRV
jgi:hypothetical protein